ncbi:unnamed protein product [Notodromas monacha]|uniref:Uracil-DNA glycosylase n=1 Tax=Notodromas monacha TaxID=399045 RepID=A0A7R9GC93_9CRUS|nr:unnamed protein product [Notodromas monacha]CAG0915747.1 unnamed protein product [Notodromas monacha]
MSKQTSLLKFLTPTSNKRAFGAVNDGRDQHESLSKKPVIEEATKTPPKDEQNKGSVVLSPEQMQKIAENRLAALIRRQSALTRVIPPNFGTSWFKALETEFQAPYFAKLNDFVMEERKKFTVYPPADLVFSWTQHCVMDQVKVVILGQDPYHQPGQAHGLCFSVRASVAVPPSLVNIYKELQADIEGFVAPKHGTLTGWAKQGVLLLNATLTVRANQANSHSKTSEWERFTDAVIKRLSDTQPYLVFLLWGANAQKKVSLINGKKHGVLKAVHPSPLSAHRGFLGCRHFSKTNQLLKENGLSPIDWSHLPAED